MNRSPLSLPFPRKAGRGWPQAGRGVGSGRARIIRRARAIQTRAAARLVFIPRDERAAIATGAVRFPERVGNCSLSLWERVRVRGERTFSLRDLFSGIKGFMEMV